MSGADGNDLPTGWIEAPLSDLGSWTGGGTPSKKNSSYWEGEIPWVSPKDMKSVRLAGTQDHISEKAIDETAAKLIPANSIAFVVRSGILEHTLPIALVPFGAAVNQDIKVLTPCPELNVEWLLYRLLGAAETMRQACRKDGTTVASIEVAQLQSFRIGVPPRLEQDRIVERIEALLADVYLGLDAVREAEAHLVTFRTQAFSGAFAETWPTKPLAEVAETSSGGTPSRKRSDFFGGAIPWIKIGDLTEGPVKTSEETLTTEGLAGSSASLLEPGVVLLAMYGASIGRLGILAVRAATNQAVCAIRPDPEKLTVNFLFRYLQAKKPMLAAAGYGGAQPNISQRYIGQIKVPLPTLEEQAAFVERVERIEAACVEAQRSILNARADAESLRRAILLGASNGQLLRVGQVSDAASLRQ